MSRKLEVDIFIPVQPKPKERARVVSQNGIVRSYTPANTRQAEDEIRVYILPYLDTFARNVPVKVEATFSLLEPSRSKYDYPITRPDLDNLGKLLLDAITASKTHRGILQDDCQIVSLILKKKYSDTVGIALKVNKDNTV